MVYSTSWREQVWECPAAAAGWVEGFHLPLGRIVRVGRDPTVPMVTSSGALQAESESSNLHAGVGVPAGDRGRLEHLCRYVLRPPIAQEAIEWTLA